MQTDPIRAMDILKLIVLKALGLTLITVLPVQIATTAVATPYIYKGGGCYKIDYLKYKKIKGLFTRFYPPRSPAKAWECGGIITNAGHR